MSSKDRQGVKKAKKNKTQIQDSGELSINRPWIAFDNDHEEMKFLMSEIPKASRAHLKMLYPYVDVDTLPDFWSFNQKANFIHINENSLGVLYRGSGKENKDAASVRTTRPIPEKCLLYYFEVEIISKGRNGYMGIGLSAEGVNLQRLPGWDEQSYGYHGDDGHSFNSSGTGQPYGPTFTTGDIIGCGINFMDRTCFYTKNGHNLGVAFTRLSKVPLYPTVGLQTAGEEIEANFGASPFIYDIEQDILALRKRISESIKEFPLNHAEWQPMLQQFVKSWLVHNGYCATAQKFAASTQQTLGESIKSIKQRYKIQQCILNGKISEAISLIMKNYPFVFERNQNLFFVLKCRHFMEYVHGNDGLVVQSDAQNTQTPPPPSSSSSSSSSSATTTTTTINDSNKKRGRTSKRLSQNQANAVIDSDQNILANNQQSTENNDSLKNEENENGSNSQLQQSPNIKNGNSVSDSDSMSYEEISTIIKLGKDLNKFWSDLRNTVSESESKRQREMLREALKIIANEDMRNSKMSDYYWLNKEVIAHQINNEIVRLMKLVEENDDNYIVPLETIIKQTKLCVELNNHSGAWLLDNL